MLSIQQIQQHLLPLDEPIAVETSLKCAAVLMPIVFNSTRQWEVILTKRAEHLKHHPGQICFPGGRYEKTDQHLRATAIRETQEEIGITPQQIQLIGQLPQQTTFSLFNITPFVGQVDNNYQIQADHNEVEEVFTAPLNFLTDPTNQQKVYKEYQGKRYHYYVIQYKHYNIWGATAKILVNFSRRINRVAQDSHE